MTTAPPWRTPDRYRPAVELDAVAAARTADRAVRDLLDAGGARLHKALDRLRSWEPGPRAATTNRAGASTPLWCDAHDRDLSACRRDHLACEGTPYRPGMDPTGEAAVNGGPGYSEERELLMSLLRKRAALDRRIVALVHSTEVRASTATVDTVARDEDWCSSCRRNGGHAEPVTRRRSGQPYYRGLCQWCGGFQARYRQLPPLPILRKRHLGQRITEAEVRRFVAQDRARRKQRARS